MKIAKNNQYEYGRNQLEAEKQPKRANGIGRKKLQMSQ